MKESHQGEVPSNVASYAAIPPFDFCISILGSGGVGKTALLRSFFDQPFEEKHIPTVDDYYVHSLSMDGKHFTLCIVDTAGSYSFPVMRSLALNSSHAYIVVYAVDDVVSFEEAVKTMEEISALRGNSENVVPVILVGNKLDTDVTEREVTAREGYEAVSVMSRLEGEYIEASAKIDFRVDKIFSNMLEALIYKGRKRRRKKFAKRRLRVGRGKNQKFKEPHRTCNIM